MRHDLSGQIGSDARNKGRRKENSTRSRNASAKALELSE
jgi:hypothetical protein